MHSSSDTYGCRQLPERAFTLIELLVVMVVAGVLLAGFTAFYLSEQRALRHHQVDVAVSQSLRTALEQMSRDLRSARRDLVNFPNNHPNFLEADSTIVRFQLDASVAGDPNSNDGEAASNDPNETRGYRLNGGVIQQFDAATNAWVDLAENITSLNFRYFDCNGTELSKPVGALGGIATVEIGITSSVGIVGGVGTVVTENERIRLRNVQC